MSLTDPDDAKRTLRAMMRGRLPHGANPMASLLTTRLSALPLPPDAVLAGIWPLPGEPDLTDAWHALRDRGHVVLLPETTPPGQPLRFRRWMHGVPMRAGRFGTTYPDGPEQVPDIVFVPLLAWDRRLHRLGHGGGYYDRTLAALPDALAIGTGLAAQEVASVPTGPYDVALAALVTERETLTAEGQRFEDLVSGRHRRSQRS